MDPLLTGYKGAAYPVVSPGCLFSWVAIYGYLHKVAFDTQPTQELALGSSCLWVHWDTQHIDRTLKESPEFIVTRIVDPDLLTADIPSLDKPHRLSQSQRHTHKNWYLIPPPDSALSLASQPTNYHQASLA